MKMIVTIGALALTAMPAFAQSVSYRPDSILLAPADPRLHGTGPRYTSVTAGLKRYGVVEPKNWIELNHAVSPRGQGEGVAVGGKRDGDAK